MRPIVVVVLTPVMIVCTVVGIVGAVLYSFTKFGYEEGTTFLDWLAQVKR